MNTPVYVISLARCTSRRQWMCDQLSRIGVTFTFQDAVDGRDLPQAPQLLPGGELLHPGELACAQSHLAVWRRLLQSDAAGAFVFEDDAVVRPGVRAAILAEVAAQAVPGEVVLLHSSCRDTWLQRQRRLKTWRGTIAYAMGDTMLATAYYLTREGAAAMVARWEREAIRFPVDHWCCREPARLAWVTTLPVLTVKPDLFDQHTEFPSEISALGRSGLDGPAFIRRQQPLRHRWQHLPREGLRYVRRLLRRTLKRPTLTS